MKITLTKVHFRFLLAAVIAVAILLFPTPARAWTYYDNYYGGDLGQTTTLNYLATHQPFNLRVWVTGSLGSKQYSVRMYNKSGGQVWSASNQGDRTYYIGNNVTKLVITRNNAGTNTKTNWQRR